MNPRISLLQLPLGLGNDGEVGQPATSPSAVTMPAASCGAVEDRALGAYLGLAVGDALGATVEFMTAREIVARFNVHNQIIGGGWLRLRPGRVTDDTEMALALGNALMASNGWNLKAVADSFATWMRGGPIDIGNTCRRGIAHYLTTGQLVAPLAEESCGNGAAMRHLPTVLASLGSEELTVRRSVEQGRITHNHPVSDAATAALARMTRRLVLEGTQAPCSGMAAELIAQFPQFAFRPWPGRTSGYVVDTVQTVWDAFFNTCTFEDCVVRAVNRGGDADTAGALAGQLAGALYGVRAIPARWLSRLEARTAASIRDQVSHLLKLA